IGRINWRDVNIRTAEDINALVAVADAKGITPQKADKAVGWHDKGRFSTALAGMHSPFRVGAGAAQPGNHPRRTSSVIPVVPVEKIPPNNTDYDAAGDQAAQQFKLSHPRPCCGI